MAGSSWYSSGERVFGPPQGTFDVEWVARELERRTGLPYATVHRAVAAAWAAARATGSLDRRRLADAAAATGLPQETADALAAYVAGYCEAYEVDPAHL